MKSTDYSENIYTFPQYISWQIEHSKDMVYILDKRMSQFYYFDGVSKEMWLLIEKKYSFDEIIKKLHEQYDIEYDMLRTDVIDFLDELLAKGLIITDGRS